MLVLAVSLAATPAAAASVALIDTPVRPDSELWGDGQITPIAAQAARLNHTLAETIGCRVPDHGERSAAVVRARAPMAVLYPIAVLPCGPGGAIAATAVFDALEQARHSRAAVILLAMTFDPVIAAARAQSGVLNELDAGNQVLVVAAGNGAGPLVDHTSGQTTPWSRQAALADQTIVVDATDGKRWPGANATLQRRFLRADGAGHVRVNNEVVITTGASAAAARVAAAIARLLHRFPEVEATTVADTLLATTSHRALSTQGQHSCGEGGQRNCMRYRHGRGKMNVEVAARRLAARAQPERSRLR